MGSCITENQFMIHILNNLTSDYDLQLTLMERRVDDADKPLTVEEVRGELNLRFERLNTKNSRNEECEILEEQDLFGGQFKGKCRNCNADRQNYESQHVVFTATSQNQILTDDIWICDSGAFRHYYKSDKGLFDAKDINEKITVGNGESMKAIKVGSLKCYVIQLNGSSVNMTLKEINYVSELWVNLFSISKAPKNRFDLSKKGLMIS
jgi:hypothetical protein